MTLAENVIIARLRAVYCAPEFAFFSHVANATGGRSTRTADALAMGLWPSRGLHLHGFEVKSHRNDWLREKKDPSKADEIAGLCDFWWVVVGDESVATPDEMPQPWGLIVPNGKKLKTAKKAEKLQQPKEIGRQFLAALLRRAHAENPTEALVAAAVAEKMESERAALEESASTRVAWEINNLKNTVKEMQARFAAFEEASGININQYNAGRIGEAARAIMNMGTSAKVRLTADSNLLRRMADDLADAAENLST